MNDDPMMVERWSTMAGVHRRMEARIEHELRRQIGLGVREFCALSVLRRGTWAGKGSLSLSDLAAAVGLSQSATSRLVARLQVHGLLVIRPSCDDRRSIEIELTDVAHNTVKAGVPVLHQAVSDAVGLLGAEGADAQLLGYLRGEPH